MIYEGKNPVLQIIGIEHIRWSGGTFQVAPREYSALTFRIHGNAAITVGQRQYALQPNEILYMPQGLAYTAQYDETEMLAIHFVTAENDPDPEVYGADRSGRLYEAFCQAHSLWQGKAPGYGVDTMAQLYHIFGLLCQRETKRNLPANFLAAVEYIHSQFKDPDLSAATICQNAGIGQTNFRLLFQKHYGKTPVEYITDLRLEWARNLIASGIPVEQAAAESGFNDPKYFARTVKKHYGCTPRQWKAYGK